MRPFTGGESREKRGLCQDELIEVQAVNIQVQLVITCITIATTTVSILWYSEGGKKYCLSLDTLAVAVAVQTLLLAAAATATATGLPPPPAPARGKTKNNFTSSGGRCVVWHTQQNGGAGFSRSFTHHSSLTVVLQCNILTFRTIKL